MYLSLGVGYILLYAAIGWLLRDQPFALSVFGDIGLLIPPLSILAAILRRRPVWRGCHRLFWDTIAIGLALWIVGHLGWTFEDLVLKQQSWLQWHTVFSLCGGICPLIAFFARPHRGVREEAVGAVGLVLASYGLLAVFIYSYFILIPGITPGGRDERVALLTLVQLNRALLFVGSFAVMVAARRTSWYPAYRWMAIATGVGFFLRIATSLAIIRGTYQSGTVYDLAWIVPFLCYAAAALASPESGAEPDTVPASVAPKHAFVSAVPVFMIPLVGYGALYLQPLNGTDDSFRALLTSVMTVAGLGMLTLRLAVQGSELERAGARMRLLAAATEQTGDLILITRENGVVEHANDAFVRALGYSREDLDRLTFADLLEPGFRTMDREIRSAVRDHGVWRGTLVRRRHDGTTFPAACTVVGLRDPGGSITHYVGVERDTTEELRLRDQLVHSERLSAIGELVAGVAHEINNPLQTIVGSVELMMDEATTPALQRDLDVVRREAGRAGQIVRNLLSFVRRSAPNRGQIDLNEVVRAVLRLREFHLQQHNIAVISQLHSAALPALANRDEIQQIVLNLILNAEQAIQLSGVGGRITVRSYSSGRHQAIEVADNGPGINPEIHGRIFEPFFTTKEVGQGTGLGLSISHGIAASHGGSLELCEGVDSGACFRLTLPAFVESGHGIARSGDQRGPVRALIVDDESAVRKLLARLLERRGFQVSEAQTGEAALAIAENAPLSLVLCDVSLPGMSGSHLYRELTIRDPKIARSFVFITGDRSQVHVEEDVSGLPILEKPFTAADLNAVLAQMGVPAAVA